MLVTEMLETIRRKLAKAIDRIDFWSIRSPLARGTTVPGLRSSHELPWLPRDKVRDEIAYVVPTHTGVRDFSNSIMEWRRDQTEQFHVQGGNARIRELVGRAFLDRRRDDPPLRVFAGSLGDLDDLFRALTWHLMVDGRTYLIAFWHTGQDLRRPAKLPSFRIVDPVDVDRRRGRARLASKRGRSGDDP